MRKRLLVVDDVPTNLQLIEAILAPLGHEITCVSTGREAMAVCDRDGTDLVLLDVMMPEIDGFAVLQHIRSLPTGRYLPVIMVTAANERAVRLRGVQLGASEFIEKPIDWPILFARVSTLLQLRDTTDTLVERNASLERLQDMQRELTGFIVHDLKNPLAAISMNIAWAIDELGATRPDVVEALTDVASSSKRMLAMIGDLLTMSRAEADALAVDLRPVDVRGLLDGVVRDQERVARDKQIALDVDGEPGLSAHGDAALLRRVLENLLGNALRHTPRGGRITLAARQGEGLEIAVSNTGFTIPVAERSAIFEKFRRGEGTSLVNAGLGLYFCKQVVAAHGGTIEVTESAEWPTSFVIRLSAV